MNIVITGGAGFLGQRLARALLAQDESVRLTLVDAVMPVLDDARVRCVAMDLREAGRLPDVITADTDAVFHLAAIVSSHAEADPDLGYEINFLSTRHILEHIRAVRPGIRLVFSSSLAVYGGALPAIIRDDTAVTPQSCYGTQKAMAELLLNDYSRKGFVDGLCVRLPTVCIRPGKPNKAASSFVSGIMREPLQGEDAVLPVSPDLRLWLSSPDTVVSNLVHALKAPRLGLRDWHVINLPGFTISVQQMLDTLADIRGKAVLDHVKPAFDDGIHAIVASWPAAIDDATALRHGFVRDGDFAGVIQQFIDKDLKK
ncbi:MAG: SDR family oxidoreductase [Lautropia sp.]|nr:SDR family oxidoreductase [Lautropia sp.]